MNANFGAAILTENYQPDFDVPGHVTSVLEVNLSAIKKNYQFLESQLVNSKAAAVLKADAYGLGIQKVAPALTEVGCQDFYVAKLDEALELRGILPNANIYVLLGLLEGMEEIFLEHNLVPLLNDYDQIMRWGAYGKKLGRKIPAIIQVETGFWRAGIPYFDMLKLIQKPEVFEFIEIVYIMSHLACSDTPNHPKNEAQRLEFDRFLKLFPGSRGSFSNSNGVFLGPQYHYDQVRPGRVLYGLGTRASHMHGIAPAVQIYARLLQIRNVPRGECIGYDSLFTATQDSVIGTISAGYADGILRSATNKGHFYIGDYPTPIVGRVSMDFITVDLTGIPDNLLKLGSWVEIVGNHISADELAQEADTTSREIMIRLGKRYHRIYRY